MEGLLQLGLLVEAVQNLFREGVFFQFNNNANSVLIGLIAQVANAFYLLFAYQIRNLLDKRGLINLKRNFRYNDRVSALFSFNDFGNSAHNNSALARRVSAHDFRAIVNNAAGRKIRTFDKVAKIFNRRFRVFNQMDNGGRNFAQVMRRNISCHTDGNAHRAIQ